MAIEEVAVDDGKGDTDNVSDALLLTSIDRDVEGVGECVSVIVPEIVTCSVQDRPESVSDRELLRIALTLRVAGNVILAVRCDSVRVSVTVSLFVTDTELEGIAENDSVSLNVKLFVSDTVSQSLDESDQDVVVVPWLIVRSLDRLPAVSDSVCVTVTV